LGNETLTTMAAVPMKPEYGPTLGRLLSPWWQGASRLVRALVIGGAVALLALLVGLALTLENARYSHGGPVPFGFSYRGLYSAQPDPGGYVKVQSRWPDGSVKYSFAVDPLRLPRYAGSVWGELPIYAYGYILALSRHSQGFELRGEGKTRISNTLTGYQVAYSEKLAGREIYARNVLLLPERPGVREGVVIAMLTSSTASAQVSSPLEVGETGVLLRPLKNFAFG
jgi:hypothetical protein